MEPLMIHESSTINMPAVLVANGLGACLMVVLLLSKRRNGKMVSLDSRIFDGMCGLCLTLCLLETLSFWLDEESFRSARQMNILANAVLFMLNAVFSYAWSVYIDYKLFEDIRRLKKYYIYGAIPAVVVCLMCVGNLFTEVFFWVTPDNVYYRASWVWITYVVTYCYLSYGAVLVFRYRNQTNKYLFMPVMLFLTPIFLCSIIQFCNYGLALIWVSTAFGLTSLYINLQNERVFLDTLTNLYNRSYLLHYMDYLTRKMQKGSHVLGIMLDVNDFKHINDTYGHQIGDQVLQTVGKVLQATVGEKGAVVRYGGDEFVVLLENAREPDGLTFRQQVNQKLETYNASGAAPCRISLSMGAAEFDNTMGMDLFFHVMDLKMYEDKRAFYQRAGNDRRRCRAGVEPGRTGEACETEQK